MLYDPIAIALVCLAVVIAGLAKGGFAGIGAMSVPLMVLVLPPMQAAAILLPCLLVQDVVSVSAYRKTWNRWVVARMIPGAFVGVALGYFFSAGVPVAMVKGALGVVTLCFALYRMWLESGHKIVAPSNSPGWVGSLFGVALGFTSHIAHAGAPLFQIWVMPRKLPHRELAGTSAVIFAIVDWAKVPGYWALGEFTRANLIASALLVPIAIASTMAGVWLVRRTNVERFYTIIYWLMVLLGGKLIGDALAT